MDWKNSHIKKSFYENAQDTIDKMSEFLEELVNKIELLNIIEKNVLKTDLLILNQTK